MKYKYSIQRQFTIIFGCLMAGTILLCWFINNTFLERYYINNKKHAMLEAYRVINASSNNGTLASDKFDIQFQNICAKNNINIVILDAEAKTLKTSANNYELLSKQLLSYLFNQDTTDGRRTILDHKKYQMIALKDDRTQQDFIDLWGVLDNGNLFLLRTPVESIRESVSLANRFLAYIGIGAAILAALQEKGVKSDVAAGLSLGEYGAILTAGAMSLEDVFRIVRQRGILMQEAVPTGGAMCAVLGMDGEKIAKICDETEGIVSVANYNCPGQIVITGKTDAVEEAAAKLKEAGARRTIMLNVSGPFHSQMLVPAGEKLAEELEHTRFHELRIPYVTNVTAEKVTDIRETPGLLTTQISSPVRWMQSMERMIADGVDTFVEIGPGKTLEGFLRKIDRSVKVFHISQWEDVDKVCEELADGGNRMEES